MCHPYYSFPFPQFFVSQINEIRFDSIRPCLFVRRRISLLWSKRRYHIINTSRRDESSRLVRTGCRFRLKNAPTIFSRSLGSRFYVTITSTIFLLCRDQLPPSCPASQRDPGPNTVPVLQSSIYRISWSRSFLVANEEAYALSSSWS